MAQTLVELLDSVEHQYECEWHFEDEWTELEYESAPPCSCGLTVWRVLAAESTATIEKLETKLARLREIASYKPGAWSPESKLRSIIENLDADQCDKDQREGNRK